MKDEDQNQKVIISENGLEVMMVLYVDRVVYEWAVHLAKKRSEYQDWPSTPHEEIENLMSPISQVARDNWVVPDDIEALYKAHWKELADRVFARIEARKGEEEPDDGIPF